MDWNNGRAGMTSSCKYRNVRLTRGLVVGDNESEIMKMINQLPKDTNTV